MGRRPKSALTDDMMHCYICGSPYTHVHHVFYGTSNRKNSDKFRYLLPLCPEHHTGNFGVHFDPILDEYLKQMAQKHFENNIGTREEFRRIFGK